MLRGIELDGVRLCDLYVAYGICNADQVVCTKQTFEVSQLSSSHKCRRLSGPCDSKLAKVLCSLGDYPRVATFER